MDLHYTIKSDGSPAARNKRWGFSLPLAQEMELKMKLWMNEIPSGVCWLRHVQIWAASVNVSTQFYPLHAAPLLTWCLYAALGLKWSLLVAWIQQNYEETLRHHFFTYCSPHVVKTIIISTYLQSNVWMRWMWRQQDDYYLWLQANQQSKSLSLFWLEWLWLWNDNSIWSCNFSSLFNPKLWMTEQTDFTIFSAIPTENYDEGTIYVFKKCFNKQDHCF